MKQYHLQTWAQRRLLLGREAEAAFRRWAPTKGVTYHQCGFEDPPFDHFMALPAFLRKMPDFVAEDQQRAFPEVFMNGRGKATRHCVIDCKGVGRDQKIKLKQVDMRWLTRWAEVGEVPGFLFIYDSHRHLCSSLLRLDYLAELAKNAEVGRYADNYQPYYVLPTAWIDHWEDVPQEDPVEPSE